MPGVADSPVTPDAVAEVTLPDGRILRLPLPVPRPATIPGDQDVDTPARAASGAGPASTLARLVWMSGQVDPPALCSGLGRCGRCAARFTRGAPTPHPADEAHFSEAELTDGWRLLCRHAPSEPAQSPQPSPPAQGAVPHENTDSPPDACCGMAFTLPAGTAPRRSRITDGPPPDAPLSGTPLSRASLSRTPLSRTPLSGTSRPSVSDPSPATAAPLLLAMDLGTTTLHWSALTPDGRRVAHGAELNPQMGAGSEVMSRLAVASSPEGLAALRRLTLAAVARIAAGLPGPLRGLCVAGNSAMTAILLGRDVSGLAAAPYRLDYAGGTVEILPDPLGPAVVPEVWIPPQPAPFVGGDVAAGMAALLYGGLAAVPRAGTAPALAPAPDPAPAPGASPRFPFLLADLGTNGEFVLATGPDSALVTSVALGPALEGIGLSCGGVAQPGAIAAFTLGPAGLAATVLPEDDTTPATPTHLCGTGYLSLLRVLLRAGLLDEDGRFVMEPHSPLARRLAALLVEVRGERRLPLPGGLHLSAGDVEEVLKVKAAFSLAYERLLAEAGMPGTALDAVYLAGALGEHARPDDLETLGFLPAGVAGRTRAVGNASLRGAELLLLRPELRHRINAWRAGCRVVDLTTASDFSAAFLRHMRFR
ncbi:ASKHA domain-containing protein [Nitratidesulfovibrio sp.]|uniref:ASKHA domain-containing protein n=1 Tax=Nitratidesulfovibrio sp. TaxID=2802297 RepID=UPI003341419B